MSKKENKKKKKHVFHYIGTFVKTLIKTLVIVCFIMVIFALAAFKPIYDDLQKDAKKVVAESDYSDFKNNLTGYIYDSDGNTLKKISKNGDSIYLPSDDIPENVKNAFIAVEDRNFYNHNGFDLKGIVRVLVGFVKSNGSEKHGASTITQQLIKNTYLSSEVTMERKIKEIFYSVELEKKYTKDEILEFYINNVYFANQYYGIESASKGYFNKSSKDLSLSEAAFLCAIPNSPTYYDPIKNYDHTIQRRDKILKNMLECDMISQEDYNKAINEQITLNSDNNDVKFNNYETTYAIECAIKYLMKSDGFKFKYTWKTKDDYDAYREKYSEAYDKAQTELYSNGYKVYTTLDSNIQEKMQSSLDDVLSFDEETQDDGTYALQGASTCIDNNTGKVVGIIGGRTQGEDNIYTLNRAYQSYRQPGSTIKPLVIYTPALMSGYNANSTLQNISVKEANKTGVDINSLHGSSMTLKHAVENSINGSAIYLYNKIGVNYGLSFIANMNFDKILPEDYNISSGLGGLTLGVTTEEMASAYYTLANHGQFKEPTCIKSIIDKNGNEIYEEDDAKEIYTSSAADDMIDIMKGVLTHGTARSIKWYNDTDIEAAGKTGTTNDNKDGWFCGVTPYYTISVWVGFDKPREMNSLYGNSYPATIWKNSMLSITDGLETKSFEKDSNNSDNYHGSANVTLSNSAYDDYLPGRDDSEVLSNGYTVYDYRVDRTIGEKITDIINQINNLNKSDENYETELNNLYNQGLNTISEIYSTNYTNEMTSKLNEAYNKQK